MDFAHGDEGHLARFEDAMLFSDPLLSLAGDNEDQFFARRMIVKGVAAERVHIRAHEKQVFVRDDIGSAEPLFECPGRLEANGIGSGDETAQTDGLSWSGGVRLISSVAHA